MTGLTTVGLWWFGRATSPWDWTLCLVVQTWPCHVIFPRPPSKLNNAAVNSARGRRCVADEGPVTTTFLSDSVYSADLTSTHKLFDTCFSCMHTFFATPLFKKSIAMTISKCHCQPVSPQLSNNTLCIMHPNYTHYIKRGYIYMSAKLCSSSLSIYSIVVL